MNCVIIGCGYIGKRIAKLWTKKGHFVTATTTSKRNLPELEKVAQKSIIVKGTDESELSYLIEENDVILVSVSAAGLDNYRETYLSTAESIRHIALQQKKAKLLLYTSSAAVYGNHNGQWVDENSSLLAKPKEIKFLMETEDIYLSLKELGWKVSIFRLAEIYGPGRELKKKMEELQGRVLPGKGKIYTNMVHIDDIVLAIDYALSHNLEGIYNLADDDHPMKEAFYNALCDRYHLERLIWDPHLDPLIRTNKRVSNHKIKSAGFIFRHPHRTLDELISH